MTIQNAFNLFTRDSLIYGKSVATISNYKHTLSALFNPYYSLSNKVHIEDITSEEINNYFIKGITINNWSKGTAWTYHKNLKAFFNWAIKKQLIVDNPLNKVSKPRIIKQPPKSLSEFEVIEILKYIEKIKYLTNFIRYRNIAIIKTFLYTGIRKNELLNLKMDDLELDSDFIVINDGKGGKNREIPIEKLDLRSCLVNYLNIRGNFYSKTDWLFKGDPSCGLLTNKRLSEGVLKRIFDPLSSYFNKKIHAHRLRHTFATLLLEKTGDIFILKELLGHANIKTTCIYLSTTRNKKIEAIGKLKLSSLCC